MTFANPWMLLGLAALAIPILIHLIAQRRPQRQPFFAMDLLLQSARRLEKRLLLMRWLLLATRTLILALFVLGAARPFFLAASPRPSMSKEGPRRIAFVLDATLSMQAEARGHKTLFSRAKALIRERILGLGSGDLATLVVAGKAPSILLPALTASKAELVRALDDVEPTFAHGTLGEAITQAARAVALDPPAGFAETQVGGGDASRAALRPTAHVVVASDLARHSVDAPAEFGGADWAPVLEFLPLVDAEDLRARTNHAVVGITTDHVPRSQTRVLVASARVRFGAALAEAATSMQVAIAVQGDPVASRDVPVEAGQTSLVTFEHPHDATDAVDVTVRIDAKDALPMDDARTAVVHVHQRIRVLVVEGSPSPLPKAGEAFYLEAALLAAASAEVSSRVVTVDEWSLENLERDFDIVLLLGVLAPSSDEGERLKKFVAQGGALWITASEIMDIDATNRVLGDLLPGRLTALDVAGASRGGTPSRPRNLRFSAPRLEHPILSIFSGEPLLGLLSTHTHGRVLVEDTRGARDATILHYEDGEPAMLLREVGEGRVLLWTTSIDRDLSDLAIRPAFVPLVRQTLLYMSGAHDKARVVDTWVGAPHVVAVRPETHTLEVTRPDGQVLRLVRDKTWEPERFVFRDTALPGVYKVRASPDGKGTTNLDFAVNTDPSESDLSPLSVDEARALLLGKALPPATVKSAEQVVLGGATTNAPERLSQVFLLLVWVAFAGESLLLVLRSGP